LVEAGILPLATSFAALVLVTEDDQMIIQVQNPFIEFVDDRPRAGPSGSGAPPIRPRGPLRNISEGLIPNVPPDFLFPLLSVAAEPRHQFTRVVHLAWPHRTSPTTSNNHEFSDPVRPLLIAIQRTRAINDITDEAFSRLAVQWRSALYQGECTAFY
jgi:hypothetical protein